MKKKPAEAALREEDGGIAEKRLTGTREKQRVEREKLSLSEAKADGAKGGKGN